MSTSIAGDYTILRDFTRATIPWPMDSAPIIDMKRLKRDMAEAVERTSGRDFSKKVTGGRNADFYRNFMNNGQDKRLTAEVYFGIVQALGRNPADYVEGMDPELTMPNATVLTSTFAMLLESLGVDPYEDERARKLARQFPNALQSVVALHAQSVGALDRPREEGVPADGEDRPAA